MTHYFITPGFPIPETPGEHLINLVGEDSLVLAHGAVLTATAAGMDAINSAGSLDRVLIDGSVYSAQAIGINALYGTLTAQLGTSGFVYGKDAGVFPGSTINEFGAVGGSRLFNQGSVQSAAAGAVVKGFDNQIHNTGTISGLRYGIPHVPETMTDLPVSHVANMTINNAGTIMGETAIQGSGGFDRITNKGSIFGDILLGGGNDLYDGRLGSFSGRLDAGLGNDTVLGGNDDEFVIASENAADSVYGNDVYDGGAGSDTIVFQAGDGAPPTLTVDLGVTTAQNTGHGFDTFRNIENIRIEDAPDLIYSQVVLVGNAGNNILQGGTSSNTLEGGLGNDTLLGTEGSIDTARFSGKTGAVANLSVTVEQNTGYGIDKLSLIDNLVGGSGNDRFTGNGFNNDLIGNAGKDTLNGGGDADQLFGGVGSDVLTGGSGSDAFIFNTTIGMDVDTIRDFQTSNAIQNKDEGSDLIYLSQKTFKNVSFAIDPEMPEIPFGSLLRKQFHQGSKAATKDQRIIYDGKTGDLFYDPNGSGTQKQIKFAHLTKGLSMSYHEFFGGRVRSG